MESLKTRNNITISCISEIKEVEKILKLAKKTSCEILCDIQITSKNDQNVIDFAIQRGSI